MKIALVHEMLVKLGGAERVLRSLTEVFPSAPVFTLLNSPKKTDKWFAKSQIHASKLSKSFLPRKFLLSKMPQAVESWNFKNYDVVISSSSAFTHGVKTTKKTKHICYVHSPMRYAWDYVHEYTQNHGDFMKWAIAKKLNPIRVWDYMSASNPDVLIANSMHVKRRIQKYWRQDSRVIYPPVNVKRFTATKKHDDYFLIVSALTPFKRIDTAIHAFNKMRKKLVIIGDGAQQKELKKISGPTITFLGNKDDKTVTEYFENCRAFIFPGEEDFGITPVEAMAAGKPVLAYGVGGVTETVKAGVSGEFFFSQTPESIASGLEKLLSNEKKYSAQKIRRVAEQYDESRFKSKIKRLITS